MANSAITSALSNISDEAYGAGWDGDLDAPSKNAVRDKIETMPQTKATGAEIIAGSDDTKYATALGILSARASDASFWGIKNLRLIEAHSGDNTRVVVNPNAMNIALNVGAHYHIMTTAVDVDSVDDLDTGTLAEGTDYYVYACTDGTNLTFKVSAASTYPSGFDANHSRKIGGFHTLCVAVGTIAGHTLTDYAVKDILPASIWCLKHRAKNLVNTGLVYDSATNKWVDIYLASGTNAASVYGATIADTQSLITFTNYGLVAAKRLINDIEFQSAAAGSPTGTAIHGASDPVTTGGHIDTNHVRMISNIGCEDCCGALHQWLGDFFGANGSLAGGSWMDGANCSPTKRDNGNARTTTGNNISARFVTDSL